MPGYARAPTCASSATIATYRLLWLAQVVSELGDWFYSLAVYNLLLELTGNKAQAVGLAVVLQVLPHTLRRARRRACSTTASAASAS